MKKLSEILRIGNCEFIIIPIKNKPVSLIINFIGTAQFDKENNISEKIAYKIETVICIRTEQWKLEFTSKAIIGTIDAEKRIFSTLMKMTIEHIIEISDYSTIYSRYCGILGKRYVLSNFTNGLLERDIADWMENNNYPKEFETFLDSFHEKTISILNDIHGEKKKTIKNLWGLLK